MNNKLINLKNKLDVHLFKETLLINKSLKVIQKFCDKHGFKFNYDKLHRIFISIPIKDSEYYDVLCFKRFGNNSVAMDYEFNGYNNFKMILQCVNDIVKLETKGFENVDNVLILNQ